VRSGEVTARERDSQTDAIRVRVIVVTGDSLVAIDSMGYQDR
jgi:hypothetical protein